MQRLIRSPDGDEDADPVRSRAVRRSQQLIPACRYGGMSPRWAETAERCGCTPVGPDYWARAWRRGLIAIQLRMRKGPWRGTDEDRTFCSELLLNYVEHLRAEEGSGGVGRGPLSLLRSATGPSGLRRGTGPGKNEER
ncbi:hypothetical protein NDU88_002273 [Pleurodeles waltl]|uniref:Uncharacterized protein n=1 Tax=Pleurodeles waltl TaxID=8319 RepID=A0AAV7UAA1_PLEWA|nr:hypothetical protein NDU88_002273 [Pleurodeles waltl]